VDEKESFALEHRFSKDSGLNPVVMPYAKSDARSGCSCSQASSLRDRCDTHFDVGNLRKVPPGMANFFTGAVHAKAGASSGSNPIPPLDSFVVS
jgi:hypothetical protein